MLVYHLRRFFVPSEVAACQKMSRRSGRKRSWQISREPQAAMISKALALLDHVLTSSA